ncbi:MAG: transposase [Halocynthiibacter sp.]
MKGYETRTKTGPNGSADKHVKEIKRKTRRQFSAEEKIRIVLDGLRGESSISELCRREGIAESLYYNWLKDFMEAGKKRLAGDTARQATSSEVTGLKREARYLKEVVAEQTLELRLLKKACSGMGATSNEICCIRKARGYPAG